MTEPAPGTGSAPDTNPEGPTDPEALTHMLDSVEAAAQDGACTLGELLDAAGPRGAVPVMTLIALLIVSPLSGIPLVSSICGSMIALCAVQAAFRRQGLWLPGVLKRRSLNADRVVRALRRVRRVVHWLERRATQRLRPLTTAPLSRGFLLLAATYGGAMPFLELVPMSSSLLAFAVTLIGLGMMLRDGLLLLISMVPPVLAVGIVWSVWFA